MSNSPIEIDEIPNILNQIAGICGIFSINDFIFSGKVKYGRPSTIKTRPKTVKKYSIEFLDLLRCWIMRLRISDCGLWIKKTNLKFYKILDAGCIKCIQLYFGSQEKLDAGCLVKGTGYRVQGTGDWILDSICWILD